MATSAAQKRSASALSKSESSMAAESPPEPRPEKTDKSRKLKKRESDRRCQRVSREKTKTRIAYLEGLVDEVKEANESGEMAPLLSRISELQAERDALAKKLRAIENILTPSRDNGDESIPGTSIAPASISTSMAAEPAAPTVSDDLASLPTGSLPSRRQSPPISSRSRPPDHTDTNRSGSLGSDQASSQPEASSLPSNLGVPQPTKPSRNTSPLTRNVCECGYAMSLNRLDLNIWYQGNSLLGAWMKWPHEFPQISDEDQFYYDTPVRAVVEGWDAVEQRGNIHPMWRMVRIVDETLFSMANDALSRLGIMFNVCRVLRAHLDPLQGRFTKLPRFFQAQIGQGDYPYATNFMPWMGIRLALLTYEHQYCSNRFWRIFINSLRTDWPFEFRDCYLYNSRADLYQVSPSFADTLGDIRRIGVTRDFFESYPELRGSIHALDEIPPSPSLRPGSTSVSASSSATLAQIRRLSSDNRLPPWSSHHPPGGPVIPPSFKPGPVDNRLEAPETSHIIRPEKDEAAASASATAFEGGSLAATTTTTTTTTTTGFFDLPFPPQIQSWPGHDFLPAEASSYINGRDFL